jgi:hypothetical protein
MRVLCLAVFGGILLATGLPVQGGEDISKALIGKWVSDDAEQIPLYFEKDNVIKKPLFKDKGQWVFAVGKYKVAAPGRIEYQAKSGGATLIGYLDYQDGVLTAPMGPRPKVTWKKAAEEKK